MMRYRIVDDNGVIVEVTNSFAQAVAYAQENKWSIFDADAHRLVYDGYRDEYVG